MLQGQDLPIDRVERVESFLDAQQSLGALGGIASTPIVNRPEVAIVGVNKIVVRPVWRDGGFVPRKTMNLSSSFDHRVVDGHDAATFIQRLRALIETPATIFIED